LICRISTSHFARSAQSKSRTGRCDRRLTLWSSAVIRAGTRRAPASSRPVSVKRSERGEDFFPPDSRRPTCSGAGMWIRGATSLADVPFWRNFLYVWQLKLYRNSELFSRWIWRNYGLY